MLEVGPLQSQTASSFPSLFEETTTNILSYPLIARICTNWEVVLMDCAAVIAIAALVITLFNGSFLACAVCTLFAVTSIVSSHHMRKCDAQKNLEQTANELRQTNERLENTVTDLEGENTRLSQTNAELMHTNEQFQATRLELESTSEGLVQTNVRLTAQVTELTLQVTQLRSCAEHIKEEVVRFQQENSHLHNNVQGFDRSLQTLDRELLTSRALCEQVSQHFAQQQQGLGQISAQIDSQRQGLSAQLEQLGVYLSELRAENGILEKIRALEELRQQTARVTAELQAVQVQFAEERAQFSEIHDALLQLHNRFGSTIQTSAQEFRSNNNQFRDNLSELSAERNRIQEILSRTSHRSGRTMEVMQA